MTAKKKEIEQLYISHHQRLQALARLLLKDDDEAQDAVSDMFARLAEGAVELPAEHPERYLTVTVRNLCFDRIRHAAQRFHKFKIQHICAVLSVFHHSAHFVQMADRPFEAVDDRPHLLRVVCMRVVMMYRSVRMCVGVVMMSRSVRMCVGVVMMNRSVRMCVGVVIICIHLHRLFIAPYRLHSAGPCFLSLPLFAAHIKQ